jgi:hypothetical protein
LIGHLDVPLPLEAAMPASRRDPEWLHGEGAGSSRAPLAMLEYALAALRHVKKLKKARLGVLYYCDEGQDCLGSQTTIQQAAERAGQVLVLRPGNPGDKVIHQRRGMRRYLVRAVGESRRLGQPGRRPGVLRWLWQRLEDCCQLRDRKARVAVSVAEVKTKAYPMLLPHEAEATLFVGFPNTDAADAVEERMREILGASRDGVRPTLEQLAHRPAMTDRRANKELRQEIREIAQAWDIPFEEESSLLPSVAGLVPKGTAVVCGMGPAAVNPFTAQEAVQRISLVQRTLLLAAFLERTTT